MSCVYLVAAPVIYLVQQVAPFLAAVRTRLPAGGIDCMSSELTLLECLVLPLRNGDTALVADSTHSLRRGSRNWWRSPLWSYDGRPRFGPGSTSAPPTR
jgi:hypothetical protein